MPDFNIIAGPNGAGKSTFSKVISANNALIFDADKIKAIKEKQYPDLPDESIGMMIDSAYWEAEEVAINSKKDFTVETNLRDDFLIGRALHLKNKGYRINLIFILLPDVYTSIDRVNLRVNLKDHYVDMESIKYNFEHGLEMLRLHFNKFDTLILIDAAITDSDSVLKALLMCKNQTVSFIDPNPPSWSQPLLDEIVQKLTTN